MHHNRKNVQLHGFCDADDGAFGAAVYVRVEDSKGVIDIILLTAKSKVAPLKLVTIPRLESCGILVLDKLIQKVQTALKTTVDEVISWTDSTIVLGWLRMSPNTL